MENNETIQPVFSHAEPVLAVSDVNKTIAYWQETLGFPGKWTWGELPDLGGVSWHGAFIQFMRNPELAKASAGNSLWIRVAHVEALYAIHQQRQVNIVAPLKVHDYGMAQYSIKDINGYNIHFAGTPMSSRSKSIATLPETVRIIARIPTNDETQNLASAIYKTPEKEANKKERNPSAIAFAVVAEDTVSNRVIGCAFLVGDNSGFYYIRNVMVHPDWQGKRV
ncbi:MAG: VOC family protein [Bacteroidota bacterium]